MLEEDSKESLEMIDYEHKLEEYLTAVLVEVQSWRVIIVGSS